MKHNLLKSVILSVILFMGVSNVWGKTVWIDVSTAPSGYTNSMFVHYWGGSSDSYVSTSDYGTVNGYKIYKAEIPNDATKWQVCRKGSGGEYCNYQWELTYSGANKYSVTGWDNAGTGTKVIGMVKGGHIYFDNIDTEWNTTYLQFVIGHGSFSRTYAVGQITNTKLHYLNLTNESSHEWPDATYYGFIATEDGWFYDGDWSVSNLTNAKSYTAPYTSDYSLDAGSVYYCKTNSTSNDSQFNINYEPLLTNLNRNQTIKYALSEYGGTPAIMNSGTTPAKITMSSYKFESGRYDAVIAESATMNANETTYSKTFTAAQTATTTLIVSEIVAGYKFDGWYKEGGELLTKETTCIYYPTASETIHARFIEVCKITLDPFPYGEYGVRIDGMEFLCHPSEKRTTEVQKGSVVEIIDRQPTHEFWDFNPKYACSVVVEPQGEGNQEITSNTYTVQKDVNFRPNYGIKQTYRVYLHLPNTKIPNTDITFVDKWNSLNSNYKNFIYAEDYLSKGQLEVNGIKKGQLIYMTKDDYLSNLGQGEYWYIDVPAGYHTFRFERKEDRIGVGTGFGARSESFKNFVMPFTAGNCYTLNSYNNSYTFTGTWGLLPNYTVQLGYCEFGEYKVMCNGNIYTSTPNQNVSFEAPYGSEITFVGGTPLYDIYKGGWMLRKFNGSNNETRLDATQPYIVTGDILLDDNFVTKDPRVCYLAVPKNNLGDWNQNGAGYFIWRHDQVGGFPMIGYSHQGQYFMEDNTYKYYKFTILEGCNKIYFQHKVPKNNPHENNDGNTLAGVSLNTYDIPISDKNCYYLTGKTTGYWDYLPIDDDQYRLLYVEQVVEKDKENNTVLTRKKAHPSDIFTKEDITTYTKDDGSTHDGKLLSLHVYRDRPYTGISWYDEEGKNHKYYTTKASNAGVILQKTVGGKWVDVSNNMVFGRLEGVPEVALLPGRKNAASSYSSVNITNLYDDDGIEPIKDDTHEDKGNGVWNFVVKKDDSGNVYIALDETHRYKGEYYIRTVAAEGGWENYKTEDENQMSENQMTRSDISKVHSNYSHYFCKWIEKNTDVQFTVANDYGCAISDTLVSDRTDLKGRRTSETEKIVRGLVLPKEASVRFSWNEKTNFIHRAYLGGSTHVSERFLVLTGSGDNKLFDLNGNQLPEGKDNPANPDPRYGLNANEEIFTDISNWVYYADVKMVPRAQVKLTADYKWKEDDKDIEVIQYFVGTPTEFCDTTLNTVDGAKKCTQQYRMRLLYDFKTNELISAYVPGGNTNIEQIKTNVMLIRQENEQASQFSFETNAMDAVGKRSYGVLELTKASLIDNYTDDDYYRVSLYWISFPFDVAIKDIFGFGTYGEHWLIQSYNGQKRADNGLWADSDTNWEYHFKPNTLNAGTEDEGIMKKGVGYVVALNRSKVVSEFKGRIKTIALYFPARNTIQRHIDNREEVNISVPAHKCTINRGTPQGDRRIRDSHWNVIGVPSYINAVSHFGSIDGSYDHVEPAPKQLQFYYKWLGDYDKYEILDTYSSTENFNSLGAYMVQYAGTLTWSNVLNERAPSLAPKRNSDNAKQYHLRLELQQNGQEQDRTFINMQKDEVTTGFDFNYDLCKINNKGANIYSLIATDTYPVEVAANVLPIEEAIIPLGVVTTTAGEYTFAMPEGTDGIVVELIDYETNTRTNMLLDNYTVNLGKGTFDNRFALHVKPDKTTTSVDNLGNEATGDKVKKYLIDGVLYMQKDGVLYDAQGKLVR